MTYKQISNEYQDNRGETTSYFSMAKQFLKSSAGKVAILGMFALNTAGCGGGGSGGGVVSAPPSPTAQVTIDNVVLANGSSFNFLKDTPKTLGITVFDVGDVAYTIDTNNDGFPEYSGSIANGRSVSKDVTYSTSGDKIISITLKGTYGTTTYSITGKDVVAENTGVGTGDIPITTGGTGTTGGDDSDSDGGQDVDRSIRPNL